MKKLKLLLYCTLFIFHSSLIVGQIMYTSLPMDSGLVARDLKTNTGTILIEGIVNRAQTPYDSICLKTYRDKALTGTIYQGLTYLNNKAAFHFSYPIKAELHEYSVTVYGIKKGVMKRDTSINAMVAGDVYIIEGQSNAFALKRDGESANSNRSEFVRVFARADSSGKDLMASLKWFTGRGDGTGSTRENGHAGQWGLRLGKLLTEKNKIPVAIFNGAFGGTPISYYERTADYKVSVESNYAREYYRLTYTKLANHVRAIIWSQGETDGRDNTSTKKYISEFDTLMKSWRQDYSGFKKVYIFQTKTEKVYPMYGLLAIEEAQREIAAAHDSDVEIIPTSDLKSDKGGLHFDYVGGYEQFGDRIYRLIERDLYGVKPAGNMEIDASMIEGAWLNDSTTLVIKESSNTLMPHSKVSPMRCFRLDDAMGATIDTVITNKNNIICFLSKYPGDSAKVSYLGIHTEDENWIINKDSMEILTFYKYPITNLKNVVSKIIIKKEPPLRIKVRTASSKSASTVRINKGGRHFICIYDSKGAKLQQIMFTGKKCKIYSNYMSKGVYTLRVCDEKMHPIGTTTLIVP